MLKRWGERQNNLVTHGPEDRKKTFIKKQSLPTVEGWLSFDVQVCFKTGL